MPFASKSSIFLPFCFPGLQLKAEQKVQVHLDKWAEHLEKFGGEAAENSGGAEDDGNGATVAEADRVRVVLKRDARALLADEQMLVSFI
jgi:hypothetical protein